MPTTWGDLLAQVKDDANKGNSLVGAIPNRVAMAIDWIEKNYSLDYMNRFISGTFLAGSNDPGPYTNFPNMKSIEFIRLVEYGVARSASYSYLTKVDPSDLAEIRISTPSKYWVDAGQWIWLDNIPKQNLPFQARYARYTGRPTTDDTTSWLFDNGYQLILGKTMQLLASYARQPAWFTLYQPMVDEGLRVLLLADEELKRTNTDLRMGMWQ